MLPHELALALPMLYLSVHLLLGDPGREASEYYTPRMIISLRFETRGFHCPMEKEASLGKNSELAPFQHGALGDITLNNTGDLINAVNLERHLASSHKGCHASCRAL